MRGKAIWIVVVVAIVIGFLWWHHHRHAGEHAGAATAAAGASAVHRGPRAPIQPATLGGRVTRKSDGKGIAGATVSVMRTGRFGFFRDEPAPLVATTGADGTWTLGAVPPGRYGVTATADGFLPGGDPDVTVAPGEQRTDIALALDAGGTLVHGTVSDFGGGSIAGAQIAIVGTNGRGRIVATTDKDGAYHVTLRPSGYVFRASHGDYVEKMRLVQVSTTPLAVDFSLVPGGTIRGVVIANDTHLPVPHANVHAQMGRGGRFGGRFTEPKTTSGDDGTFVLAGCPSGLLSIGADGGGYTTQKPTDVRLGIGEAVAGIEVHVDRGFTIAGHVLEKDSHAPIAGVNVAAMSFGFGGGGAGGESEDPTGSDGAFEITGVAPGSYMMIASAPDVVPDIGKQVTLADKDVTGVELEIERGVTLTGRVEPAGSAQISLDVAGEVGFGNMMSMAKIQQVQGTADGSGAWKLDHVPSGSWKLVARTDAGDAGELPVTVTGKQDGLVIALSPRASIAGKVVDSDGKPVPNVEVTARAANAKGPGAAMRVFGGNRTAGTTAADGSFTIVGLEGGAYSLVAGSMQDQIAAMRHPETATSVEVTAGTAKTGVVITLPAKTGVIHGRVVDADKQPVADAWVTARADGDRFGEAGDPALTADGGTFDLGGLGSGTYTLTVDGGKLPAHAEKKGVHPGETVEIQLEPLGKLSGHVTSGGTPIAAYKLECNGPSGSVERSINSGDGAYSIDNLPPGSYHCTATADAGEVSDQVDVAPNGTTLDLAIAPYGSITGTVVNAVDGSPVPGALVSVRDRAHFMALLTGGGAHTDAAGHFRIDRVAAGSGSIDVLAATGGMRPLGEKEYAMTAGGTIDLGSISVGSAAGSAAP